MALRCYLHPTDSASDPQGPLSPAVLCVVINKVNTELDVSDEKVKPVTLTINSKWIGTVAILTLALLVPTPGMGSCFYRCGNFSCY